MRHESTASISAPQDEVWAVLADVPGWPRWTPTVSSVAALDGELRVGRRFRVKQPGVAAAVWEVVEVEPGSSFCWATRFAGGRMVASHWIRAAGEGSEVRLRIDFTGGLARLLTPLVAGRIRRFVDEEAAALKRICESSR
ncbi:Polyketide cyclase / dehydrase and lipid transport [Saccharopolyspora kobensis]|uniref:Polyketide cyclase / dehydrase and lipid transport n=1 Tax=Saccharopolyspora kobensis TaxID=146035 RepID=A0A1H6D4P4_9PSEU|nr:SRPBCC family protein [Saccharopolyspora kobensis]SEG80231.1 Polyketide cyclase / dehydrase and lipid transport [Saccharopolyspora kobensis]SFD11208.1 Polyketide cyclase / dehydrase and lipid transport [Saccharopolyspora kobensis]